MPAENDRGPQTVCEKCRFVTSLSTDDWRRWLPRTRAGPGASRRRPRDDWPSPFRYTHADLRRGRARGCWVCTAVHQRLAGPGADADRGRLRPERDFCRVGWACQRVTSPDDGYGDDLTFHLAGDGGASDAPEYLIVSRQGTATEIDDLARNSLSRSWTGHRDLAKLGAAWLSDCLASHPSCRASDTGWMPLRLLDVSAASVRLVSRDSLTVKGPYATLSHCWGPEVFETLTHASYAKFCRPLSAEDFLPTFRDAIVTVRRLGIRYLWIDCFCILQDDAADWETQAAEMKNVYENSWLNIGAATSKGPRGGLFTQRTSADIYSVVTPCRTPPAGANIESSGHNIVTRENRSTTLHEAVENLNATRLMSRAWVLQECVLSPRMLSFCAQEMVWQCSQALLCESVPRNPSGRLPQDAKHAFWALGAPGGPRPVASTGPAESLRLRKSDIAARQKWFDVLDTYCRSFLTFPSKDILKALEGVGQRSARLGRTTYRHGIQESTLPQALGFHVSPESRAEGNMPPPAFQGPTWHWASHKVRGMRPGSIDYSSPLGRAWCTLPLAYAFMSTSCGLEPPLTDETDLWPHMLCIGRVLRAQSVPRTCQPPIEPQVTISAEGAEEASFEVSTSGLRLDPVTHTKMPCTFYLLPLLTELQGGLGGSTSGFEFLVLRQSGRGTYLRAGTFASFESPGCWQRALRLATPSLVDIE